MEPESCKSYYSIKNGEVVIREIDKSKESELIEVVSAHHSNVKNGIETR